jgi:hypothetical protein
VPQQNIKIAIQIEGLIIFRTIIAWHFEEAIRDEEEGQGNIVLHAMKMEVLIQARNFRISD